MKYLGTTMSVNNDRSGDGINPSHFQDKMTEAA
jgi:hypothetical protein